MFWQDKRTLKILEDYTKNKISKKKSLPNLTLLAQSSPAFLQFMWFRIIGNNQGRVCLSSRGSPMKCTKIAQLGPNDGKQEQASL